MKWTERLSDGRSPQHSAARFHTQKRQFQNVAPESNKWRTLYKEFDKKYSRKQKQLELMSHNGRDKTVGNGVLVMCNKGEQNFDS
jgi:hypothetical protein